jgi:penicillin amidase
VDFVPFEKLPSVFDAPSGILATANGRITPDGYPNSLSVEWEAPYRTQRIYRVLQSPKKFSAADMLALQTDIYSEFDHFCAEHFVYALDHAKAPSARARGARDLMRNWDGGMRADSAAAAIEVLARRELYQLVLEPKLGPAPPGEEEPGGTLSWKTYDWFSAPVWMENVLLHQPKRWLPSNYQSYDELLAAAVEHVVNRPGAPRDLAAWKWGSIGAVDINHPLFGSIPFLGRWTGPGRQPQSGNGYTVKAVGHNFGPSERTTVDLSNLDNSTLNIVTGQSGNVFSPYYMDQWNAWYQGRTFTLPFTREAVDAARTHQLRLELQK